MKCADVINLTDLQKRFVPWDNYMSGKDGRTYEICSDQLGRRLWINADDGSAVGRFNTATGVDLHNTISDQ